MKIIDSPFEGCYLLQPHIIKDERGYFFESFNSRKFLEATGSDVHFVQDNQSFSSYGVIRGLHSQAGSHAQAKLVRVLSGEVLDVIVDGRQGSKTYGQSYSVRLNTDNNYQLFVPRGFFHGFAVISEQAEFFYKCDNFYNKESERGVHFADPELGIDWLIAPEDRIVTEKDRALPYFNKGGEK